MRYVAFLPLRTSSLLESKNPVLNSIEALAGTSSTDLAPIKCTIVSLDAAGATAAAAGAAGGGGGRARGGARGSRVDDRLDHLIRHAGVLETDEALRAHVELRLARFDLRDDDRVREPGLLQGDERVVREHFLRGERRRGEERQRRQH